MISGIFIFNQKGEVLISRLYRHDLKRSIADVFRIQVLSSTDIRSPITTLGSTTFFHVKRENIYIVAVTKVNANAALVFEFLNRLVDEIGRAYFGKMDEEGVKNNFVLIYELLDAFAVVELISEILDFGYPQTSDIDSLKMYITTESIKSERAVREDSSRITTQATGAMSYRRSDIKYRRNEAFVDVIENVNLLMSATGTALRADVSGQIMMRAFLTGTPECRFGLNDSLLFDNSDMPNPSLGGLDHTNKAAKANAGSVTLEDCQFHQCVRLGKFDSDRTISFIPPDGEFELMRYRATSNIHLPFRVHPIITEHSRTRVSYEIAIKATFSPKLYATDVLVRIPTPLNTAEGKWRCSNGKAKWEQSENVVEWKISRFVGGAEFSFSGEATLSSDTHRKAWSRPPIGMEFSIVMFTSSGLLVRYLKVIEKSGYSSVKWVKYITRAARGSYEIRF